LFAASAVRELPLVAAVMPENPASMEHRAPVKNAIEVLHSPNNNPNTINTTTIKMAKMEYSFFKNAIAPSWIIFSNSCINGVPLGCFLT
jgi:hypothetical protein